ncbi:MAG: phosphoribosylamine--glycine ligase [Propionibacteriaceae bacterium]|nr:phosphoribosylamine--glycine ligase [Propionibacteriaceae bacterium]
MTVVVIGSGGREHALALAMARDPQVEAVHVAPGNPGTWGLSRSYGLDPNGQTWAKMVGLDVLDPLAITELTTAMAANLVVIGPEAPLVAGAADAVRAMGVACFGPSAAAARLEGSKQFAKDIMAAANVPTARSRYCRTPDEAAAALEEFGAPYVVKNDGLAGGKGVLVTEDRAAAQAHANDCGVCVIEEYLDGPEVSLFAICDGERAIPLLPAQDFKRVGDGDAGPNTGGMGAYTPLPWAPEGLTEAIMTEVIEPTMAEMTRRGTPFQGLLYAGLALTNRGLRVVEFNVRFGDPETEAILPLLESPLGQVLYSAATGFGSAGESTGRVLAGESVAQAVAGESAGRMAADEQAGKTTADEPDPTRTGQSAAVTGVPLTAARTSESAGELAGEPTSDWPIPSLAWTNEAAVTVVVAAEGYPGRPRAGGLIHLPTPPDRVDVIHCGTSLDGQGDLIAHGGRVLAIVARGENLTSARQWAYDYLSQIDFVDGFYRHDIAQRAADGAISTPVL